MDPAQHPKLPQSSMSPKERASSVLGGSTHAGQVLQVSNVLLNIPNLHFLHLLIGCTAGRRGLEPLSLSAPVFPRCHWPCSPAQHLLCSSLCGLSSPICSGRTAPSLLLEPLLSASRGSLLFLMPAMLPPFLSWKWRAVRSWLTQGCGQSWTP